MQLLRRSAVSFRTSNFHVYNKPIWSFYSTTSDIDTSTQALMKRRLEKYLFYKQQYEQSLQQIPKQSISIQFSKQQDSPISFTGTNFETTPLDIAKKFFPRDTVKEFIISQITSPSSAETILWDLQRPLEHNCQISFLTFDDSLGKQVFWHSSSHILGLAMEQQFFDQNLLLSDGPALSEEQQNGGGGFFYEASINNETVSISTEDFAALEQKMKQIIQKKFPFERIELPNKQAALDLFGYNRFKTEIIDALPEDAKITVYRCGDLIDLCRGPHIPHTGLIKSYKISKSSGVMYSKQNTTLQRVYGLAFPNENLMQQYIKRQEEALKRDHRLIGKNQELFMFHEWSPGSPFFYPHGTRVITKLIEFMRREYRKRGYEEVLSPQIYNKELWKMSGHWDHYKEDMFIIQQGVQQQEHHHHHHEHERMEEIMGLKPMNCPGHCLMFASRVRSYKELPIRWADFSPLHRNELRGALSGLTRVRRFHQDDSHIFCTVEQIPQEIEHCLEFIKFVYDTFGMKIKLTLSTRPTKYVGSLEDWNKAEDALKECLQKVQPNQWKMNEGDGAFYGPKIDVIVEDSLQRNHQCATIQLDFQMPQRFQLKYQSEEGKFSTPVMIHRAILGSLERFFALLIEHVGGKWPFWLNPRQVAILPLSDKFVEYAKQVQKQIATHCMEHNKIYHVDVDESDNTLKKKIREAQLSQYSLILVVGQQEMDTHTVNVRVRSNTAASGEDTASNVLGSWSMEQLLQHMDQLDKNYL